MTCIVIAELTAKKGTSIPLEPIFVAGVGQESTEGLYQLRAGKVRQDGFEVSLRRNFNNDKTIAVVTFGSLDAIGADRGSSGHLHGPLRARRDRS